MNPDKICTDNVVELFLKVKNKYKNIKHMENVHGIMEIIKQSNGFSIRGKRI